MSLPADILFHRYFVEEAIRRPDARKYRGRQDLAVLDSGGDETLLEGIDRGEPLFQVRNGVYLEVDADTVAELMLKGQN